MYFLVLQLRAVSSIELHQTPEMDYVTIFSPRLFPPHGGWRGPDRWRAISHEAFKSWPTSGTSASFRDGAEMTGKPRFWMRLVAPMKACNNGIRCSSSLGIPKAAICRSNANSAPSRISLPYGQPPFAI